VRDQEASNMRQSRPSLGCSVTENQAILKNIARTRQILSAFIVTCLSHLFQRIHIGEMFKQFLPIGIIREIQEIGAKRAIFLYFL
jgi:hypothetical protein